MRPEDIGTTEEELRGFDRAVVLRELAETKVLLRLGEHHLRRHKFSSVSSVTKAMRAYTISAAELTQAEAEVYSERRLDQIKTSKHWIDRVRDSIKSHRKGYGVNWPGDSWSGWRNGTPSETLGFFPRVQKECAKYNLKLEEIETTDEEIAGMKIYLETLVPAETTDLE